MQFLSDHLICFSHLRWGFVYQRPQHLMSRFAARLRTRGGRVLFWEEPVFEDGVSPSGSLEERFSTESGVHVLTPHLPNGIAEHAVNDSLRKLLDGYFEQQSINDFTAWYYTPMMLGFTHHLKPALTVYDCMDELSLFRGAPAALREREDHLFCRADLVFTGGETLFQAKKQQHGSVHAFPSSVDVQHFETGRAGLADPDDQAGIPHPRIGWCGVIDERMDIDLLRGIAESRPDWQFVMIGPVVKIDPATLPRITEHPLSRRKTIQRAAGVHRELGCRNDALCAQ